MRIPRSPTRLLLHSGLPRRFARASPVTFEGPAKKQIPHRGQEFEISQGVAFSTPLVQNSILRLMDAEFTTALSSFFAAIVIVTASFFQWREVRVNGELRSQRWVNVLCAVVLLYLAVLVLIFLGN